MIDEAKVAAMLIKQYGPHMTDEDRDAIWDMVDMYEVAKHLKEFGPPFNPREAEVLAATVGDMDDDHSYWDDGDLWTDDILNKYAEHVFNAVYQYNDEAKKVDPTIDTSETHVGPMAQQLQQVAPSVVKEDPKSGYLTVDTGRLALLNAGAIADLARELQEIKNG